MTARRVGAVVLFLLALACGYLFLAGFEYPGLTPWKVFTGGFCVLLLVLAALLASTRVRL